AAACPGTRPAAVGPHRAPLPTGSRVPRALRAGGRYPGRGNAFLLADRGLEPARRLLLQLYYPHHRRLRRHRPRDNRRQAIHGLLHLHRHRPDRRLPQRRRPHHHRATRREARPPRPPQPLLEGRI
ncbi:MAG: hypothetical protein AVDCRST_MAG22-782, partial [uncultured Rubrobacteraceae bacterium]